MVIPVVVEPLDGMALVDNRLILTSEVEDRDAIRRAFRLLLDRLRDASPTT